MALEADFDEIQRSGEPYCVLFGDLNGFKQINDTYSHEAGDVAPACKKETPIRRTQTSGDGS